MVAGVIAIPITVPYVGYAADSAAYHNIQNIACIDHTKQYFVCKSIQLWLDISAIIVLVFVYDIGVVGIGDGYQDDDGMYDNVGVGMMMMETVMDRIYYEDGSCSQRCHLTNAENLEKLLLLFE